MNTRLMIIGAGVIAFCFILGLLVFPVAVTTSTGGDTDGDGTNDSVYSASLDLLNNGQTVINRPFSLTMEGQKVTDLKISVSWNVGGDDVNWATLQVHGAIDFKYLLPNGNAYSFKTDSFSAADKVSSWASTYPLADMCTLGRIGENYLGDTWDFIINIVVSTTANDNDGKALSATAPTMSAHIVIIRIAGSLTIQATGTGQAMDATGGGISLTNPAVLCLVAGIALIVISLVMRSQD